MVRATILLASLTIWPHVLTSQCPKGQSAEEIANGMFHLVDNGQRRLIEENKVQELGEEDSSDEENEAEIDLNELQSALAVSKCRTRPRTPSYFLRLRTDPCLSLMVVLQNGFPRT